MFRLLLLFTFYLIPVLLLAQPPGERAILEIVINGHNEGQQFLSLSTDGDVLFTPKLLKTFRLRSELWAGQSGEVISLRALTPQIQFTLDQNNATLNLAIPPHWFEPQTIRKELPPAPPAEKEPTRPLAASGFLNYSIESNFSGEEDLVGVNSSWEIGFNKGQWLTLATFDSNYDKANGTIKTVRQKTSILWDDVENMRSLHLGDFTPPYNLLNGGGNFAGISWRKNFRLDRTFRYTSDLSLETIIESPTHAQLYTNGRQTETWDLLPGIVNFADISTYAGGDAELVLTDAFGRERRLGVPSNTSQQILKKGLQEYAYSFGWQRQNAGQSSIDYGQFAALGFHRYGFGDTWTGGIAVATASEAFAGGVMLSSLLGNLGQIESGVLFSRDAEGNGGHTATARYSYRHKKFNSYLSLTETSQNYTQVPSTAVSSIKIIDNHTKDDMKTPSHSRYQGSLNLNYTDLVWGGLGVSYAENHDWNDEIAPHRLLSLTYRKQFRGGIYLTLGSRHDLEVQENDEVYLTLQYFPKDKGIARKIYDNLSMESRYPRTGSREEKINLQKSFPRGIGHGYVAALTEKDGDFSANLRGQYKNERGIYTAVADRSTTGQMTGSFSIAGSLSILNSELYQGRPITDSFAVVRVEGLNTVAIENSGSPMGKTGSSGTLLIPDLSSYNKSKLSIATLNLPMNYTLTASEQEIEVKQRSGSLVTFQLVHFTAVEGHLYLSSTEGGKGKLESLPLEVTINSENRDSFVGRNGYFYLENLPVGELFLRVRRAKGDCGVRLTIPESDKIVTNLGELACDPAPTNSTPL